MKHRDKGDKETGRQGDRETRGQGDKEMRKGSIKSHEDLEVYQVAFGTAMKIFEFSKKFPVEERYALTDQMRRSSRSVCANLAEAWRKRRYAAAFVAKLNDCEAEAAETQTWIKFAVKCNYLDIESGRELYATYNQVLGSLVSMINNPSVWVIEK
jgi:four helix bundle protein